jgi:hypothetical protein
MFKNKKIVIVLKGNNFAKDFPKDSYNKTFKWEKKLHNINVLTTFRKHS